MDPVVLERALDLLFDDGSPVAQLGFFGGEPFLAFTAMQRAVTGARERARRAGAELLVQCTTNATRIGLREANFIVDNDVHVTVSLDGVGAVHDAQRPAAGGGPSFEAALGGLRRLIEVGAEVEALLVVTPASAAHLLESVEWLWWMGVPRVGVNVELRSAWGPTDLEVFGAQLEAVARSLLTRLLRGEEVGFDAFGALALGPPTAATRSGRRGADVGAGARAGRARVVVATGGNLYGCAPLVGEDRDGGPEAALRLGHLGDGPEQVRAAVAARGTASCETGRCACAAYLETGDPERTGPVRRWFEERVEVLRHALDAALDQAACERAAHQAGRALAEAEDRSSGRRTFLRRLALGSATLGLAALAHVSLLRTAGKMPASHPAALPPPPCPTPAAAPPAAAPPAAALPPAVKARTYAATAGFMVYRPVRILRPAGARAVPTPQRVKGPGKPR